MIIAGRGSRSDQVLGESLTEARFSLKKFRSGYFRITIIDSEDRKAWSNPHLDGFAIQPSLWICTENARWSPAADQEWGRLTARMLGARGARVAVLDLNGDAAEATAKEIRAGLAFSADVADESSVKGCARRNHKPDRHPSCRRKLRRRCAGIADFRAGRSA